MNSQELQVPPDNAAKAASQHEEAQLLLELLRLGNQEIARGEFSDAEDVFARFEGAAVSGRMRVCSS